MQQKELKFSTLDVRSSFLSNQKLSHSLRNSSHPKKTSSGEIVQKFPSGKEYVRMAREEIYNTPLKNNENVTVIK
jgi:hypothetical protein